MIGEKKDHFLHKNTCGNEQMICDKSFEMNVTLMVSARALAYTSTGVSKNIIIALKICLKTIGSAKSFVLSQPELKMFKAFDIEI